MTTSSFDKELDITYGKLLEQVLDIMENPRHHCEYYTATSPFNKEPVMTDKKVVDQILDMMKNTRPHCEYCMDETNLINGWNKDGEFARYMWIENNSIGLEVHHKLGDIFLDYVDINYCPICGRALNK